MGSTKSSSRSASKAACITALIARDGKPPSLR
jgi:hypothetical protein